MNLNIENFETDFKDDREKDFQNFKDEIDNFSEEKAEDIKELVQFSVKNKLIEEQTYATKQIVELIGECNKEIESTKHERSINSAHIIAKRHK